MRAITSQQPWAWAIIHGGKDIENRTTIGTWRPAIGQRIAIHAGQRWSDRGPQFEPLLDAWRSWVTNEASGMQGWCVLRRDSLAIELGAIIGTAELVDVHPAAGCCAPWGEASYTEHGGAKRVDVVHLVLEHPRRVEPIPCRGALGLWTVPYDIAARLA
jgi:hypothetical protein